MAISNQISVKIGGDAKGLQTALTNAEKSLKTFSSTVGTGATKLVSGIGNAAAKVAKTAAIGLAAGSAAVVAIGKNAIQAYADYEQLSGGIETLFGDSYDVVMENANKAFQTAQLSANQYMETVTSFSASLLQGLSGDTAKAAEYADRAVVDMADNANKMGTSIEMIQSAYQGFAKQNYTMLDNLKLGYGGTQTEMKRLIADASKMTDVQKELGITVDASSMSFDNIVNAISVVQKHLGIAGTSAEEASKTISGSLNSMKSAWKNALVGIADDSQDFGALMDNLVTTITNFANNLMPRIIQAFSGIGKLVSSLAPVITKALPQLVSEVMPSLLDAAASLVEGLVQALPQLLSSVSKTLVDFMPNFINTIKNLMPQVVNGIVTSLPIILDAISQLISGIVNAMPDIIQMIAQALPMIIQSVIQNLQVIVQAIVDNLPAMIQAIAEALPMVIQSLADSLPMLITPLVDALPTVIRSITDALPGIMPQLVSAVTDAILTIAEALTEPDMLSAILDGALTLFMSIVDSLPIILERLLDKLPDIISNIVAFLTSPETIMTILEAAVKLFFSLVDAVPRILGDLIASFGKLVGNLWNNITQFFSEFAGNFGEFIGNIFKGAINGVLGFIEGVINGPINLINGFIDVINGAFGWIGVNLGKIDLIQLPRLESGGIIPGNSYSGDHQIARVNSGEMVINRTQQAALWSAIKSGNYGNNSTSNTTDSSDTSTTNNNQTYNYNLNLSDGAIVIESQGNAQVDGAAIVKEIYRAFKAQGVEPLIANAGDLRS